MTDRAVLSRHALAVLIIILSLFSRATTRAASVSLAWNPSQTSTVLGYEVHYGITGSHTSSNVNVGTNTSVTVSNLTPGVTYFFVVLAYNSSGQSPLSNQILYSIPPLPLITSAPLAQAVMAGSTATFTVSVTSTAPVTYQWFDGTAALPGATNATLTLSNVNSANAGNYSVVIANSSGNVTSSVAKLQMTNAPTLAITKQGNNVMVSWPAVATEFTLQQKSGLAATNWTACSYPVTTNGATASVTISPPLGNLYFRLFNQLPAAPMLAITKSGNGMKVSWPSSATQFTLQQNANLATTNWAKSSYPISTNGTMASITISPPAGSLYFRLAYP